ncbi:hypothetical protein SLA2020_277250 [Shorea laevis]
MSRHSIRYLPVQTRHHVVPFELQMERELERVSRVFSTQDPFEPNILSGNNFTDPIPETFGNLKNFTDFRIDGTKISGKIPDFIGNWSKLQRLDMQGTPMEGPIPSSISLLIKLSELRISDLNGPSNRFPNLQDSKDLKHCKFYIYLICYYEVLRNCLITDSIPPYIFKENLTRIDLSFNNLSGPIPETSPNADPEYMFLTNNSLTGEVPPWILKSRGKMDLSYNNFSGSTDATNCVTQSLNLVSGYSSLESNLLWCLKKDLPCPHKPQYYSLFINCGGNKTNFEGNEYEKDLNPEGASHFSSFEKWAYSSTGVFTVYDDLPYIEKYTSSLNVSGPEVYWTARLAPLSLKYYGLCLRKGSYRVKLYFAEIMYSDDQTLGSLGKRIFDVSIQGNLFLKDFNIMEAAGGVGIGIHREFDVNVTGSTLEIHLYWAGKGTTTIPKKGVYGPLISAIAVTPNFDTGKGLPAGAIAGIVLASCVLLVLTLVVLRMKGYLGGKDLEDKGVTCAEF